MPSVAPIIRTLRGGLKVILPLVALGAGLAAFVHLKNSTPVPPKPKQMETVHTVRTSTVSIGEQQPTLKLYGETRAGRSVELRALVMGTVHEIGANLRDGGHVADGERLLVIDSFQYEGAVVEAKAKIAASDARLEEIAAQIKAEEEGIQFADEQLGLARKDLERAMQLIRRGNVTQQGADQRRLTVSQRQQAVRAMRSNLAVLKAKAEQERATLDSLKWTLKQAERNLRDTVLTAPFDGYVSEVNANIGKLVNANDRVAILLDRDWIEVVFNLSDQQYGRIQEGERGLIGRKIKVKWNVGNTPHVYDAVIERVAAQITSETGGVAVYARLRDPLTPYPIRAGAFVEIDVPDRTHKAVVRLPQTALYMRSRVYTVNDENRLEERKVELIGVDGEDVLLRGNLYDGDRVVTTRLSTIGAGMKVNDLANPSPKAMPGAFAPKGGMGKKERGADMPPSNLKNKDAAAPRSPVSPATATEARNGRG